MEDPNFVGIRDGNVEHDFIPPWQVLWPFSPQHHPRHIQQIWGASENKPGCKLRQPVRSCPAPSSVPFPCNQPWHACWKNSPRSC